MARNKKNAVEDEAEAGDFDNILNRQWDDIPEVVLLPSGSYVLRGKNAAYKPATENGNAKVLFFLIPKEPMDDVSPEALEALGADYDFSSNQIVKTVWIESNRDWATVKDILTKAGVDVEAGTIQDSLKAFKGAEVVAYVDQREYTSKGQTRQENTADSFTALA